MNWVNNEFQEKQQGGLMAAMFGDSRFKGLDMLSERKIVSFLCVILLVLTFFPLVAHAKSNNHVLTVKYKTEDGAEHTAELEKIGDMDEDEYDDSGEAFISSLPANSQLVNVSSDSESEDLAVMVYGSDRMWKSVSEAIQSQEERFLVNKQFLNQEEDDDGIVGGFQVYDRIVFLDGGKEKIKTDKVKGCIVRFADLEEGERDFIFIQISTEGAASVNKEALLALINSVPTSGYHTENDRWNGIDESKNGFWADVQAIKAEMQTAYEDDDLTQAQVDAKVSTFSEQLDVAKAKLIEEKYVNATNLYYTNKGINATTWNQDNYSEGSWQRFNNAREVATNLIAELYNAEDGKPTEANGTSIKQSDVDAANDLLVAAKNDLLEKDVKKILPRWLNVAGWVLEQDPKEAKYTPDSFASWSSAKEVVSTYVQQGEEEILRSKTNYRNFMNSVVDAVTKFYALEESAESITVHVRVVDNYGMKYPQYAIEDKRTSAFDGDIILSQNKTLQGLFGEEGKLDTAPKELTDYEENQLPEGDGENVKISSEKFKRPRNIMHSHTYAYINGTLAVSRAANEEVEMATLTHFDLYDGEFATVENDERCVADHFKLLNTKLSDGDDIVIVRAEAPMARYWAQANGLLCHGAYYRYHYHNFTELTIDGDKVIEAKPDEKLSVTVHEQEKTADTNDPEKSYAKDVNLFLSDSQVSQEAAKVEPALTIVKTMDGDDEETVATDEDGTAEFSVAKEGWYKLQVAKTATQREVYYDQDKTTDGIYPNLAAGDYIMLHISLDDDFDALIEPETAAENAFDALETAEAAYEASKSAAAEAAETPGEEAVAAASQAVDDAEAAVKAAEDVKTAAEAYLEKVTELAEKKDQMSDAHKAEIEEALTKAAADVRKAENAVASGKEELADAKEVLDKAETKAALKKYQEEIAALKAENAEQQGRINELLTANETAQEEITALKAANTASKEEISDLKDEIAANEAKIAELEEQGGDNEELIAELQAANETAQGKIGELAQTITANQTEIGTLKEQIAANQEEIQKITAEDPLAAARKEAIDKVNKYLEDNAKNILGSDTDSAELAALKALIKIKDAKTAEEITNAADAAIAKIAEKIAAKEAADEKAAKIKAAKAQKVTGLKVKVKKNKATVSWKKNTAVTGYEVYRSLKKKSGYKKVATIKKNTKIKFVNKNLKAGKKYYYKVRTFTTIDGKAYYGKYTKVKATKIIK